MKKTRKQKKRTDFDEAIDYLKESKNYAIAIGLIFACGLITGFVFSGNFSFLDEFLKEIMQKIEGMNAFELILFILGNNAKSAFSGMVFGLVLGIFPVIVSMFNGILLGYVMKGVWINDGFGQIWRILPHGIFELPAVFISLGLGLKLGMTIFSKRKKGEFLRRVKNSALIFLSVVVPLLVIAAVIEGVLISLYK